MRRLVVMVAALGILATPAAADDGDDNRGGRNKNGRSCEGSQDCSTLSPSFEDSPVILCLPQSTCNF